MSSYRISDDEREALRGLPLAARVLYVEGLRPYMDYRAGTAGVLRRISYQQLREVLDVEPVPGVPTPPRVSDDQIKRLLATLERAGLIRRESVRIEVGESTRARLIVRFLLAETDAVDDQQDTCARNQAATWAPDQADTWPPDEMACEINGLMDCGAQKAATAENARPPRPPVSGKDDGDDGAGERAREGEATAFAERRTWLSRQGWTLQAIQTAKVVVMVKDWALQGVPLDALARAVEVARSANAGELPRSPMYLAPIVRQIVAGQQRGGDGGRTAGRGRVGGGGRGACLVDRLCEQDEWLAGYRAREAGAAERVG